jgi:hypothetical protein
MRCVLWLLPWFNCAVVKCHRQRGCTLWFSFPSAGFNSSFLFLGGTWSGGGCWVSLAIVTHAVSCLFLSLPGAKGQGFWACQLRGEPGVTQWARRFSHCESGAGSFCHQKCGVNFSLHCSLVLRFAKVGDMQ